MAEVTGPIRTLPGSFHSTEGAMCDEHPDRKAVARVQGETDSFGAEMYDMCQECLDEYKANLDNSGTCDWCKKEFPKLRPKRDIEEGSSGPVYYVCDECIEAYDKRMREEAEEYEDDYGYWPDEY